MTVPGNRLPDLEVLFGNTIARILANRGYRGHNAPPHYKSRVFISGEKRGVTPKIKRELRRRSAIEPLSAISKAEHRMGGSYLWYRHGDLCNADLADAGYTSAVSPSCRAKSYSDTLRRAVINPA